MRVVLVLIVLALLACRDRSFEADGAIMTYQCDDHSVIELLATPEWVEIHYLGETQKLHRRVAASGSRYEDEGPRLIWWSKGQGEAMLLKWDSRSGKDKVIARCQRIDSRTGGENR